MKRRHILSLADLEASEIAHIVDRTVQIASDQAKAKNTLRDKVVGIYFRKTSTRTRTSFTVGAAKLVHVGGDPFVIE